MALALNLFLQLHTYSVFLYVFLSSSILKINFFFRNVFSGTPSECQTVWIQIRTDILSGLIKVQTVCNSYRHTSKVADSKEGVMGLLCTVQEEVLRMDAQACKIIERL